MLSDLMILCAVAAVGFGILLVLRSLWSRNGGQKADKIYFDVPPADGPADLDKP